MIRLKVVFRIEVQGKENIPKDNNYIICPNHLSTLDPPMIAAVFPRAVSFMAKQELFDIKFIRWWLDWLGAFAVDRETLAPSTIKTAVAVHKSKWVLGLFPQGTRGVPGEITGVGSGFAGIAKITKCGILPVGILGTEKATHIPFTGKIIVKIGKLIPYSDNLEEVREKWITAIEELTGFKYIEAI
jgi:1-acyl-sn-glycerol-3-phosphate acyltransferase